MLRRITHLFDRTPWWVPMVVFALLTTSLGVVVGTLQPPTPAVHDEFAYLLASDTFASGRVTNPTHAHWESFESFHIIHEPSYASKYPPAPGLFLALGQVLFGNPFMGVCIASGLAAAACYWMLLGWVPRRWANLGGLVLMLHPSIQLNWGQSFWGGTLPMLGGALVVGATFRLRHGPRVSSALIMALGALVLANSRPYEGAVACLVCGVWVLLAWSRQGWPDARAVWLRAVAPFTGVMAIGAALMLGYNYQITGDPLKMPYVVHEAEYGLAPLFLWQKPKADHDYRHQLISDYHHGWSMDWYRDQQTLTGLIDTKWRASRLVVEFFFPLPVAVMLLAAPWLRGRRLRAVLLALLVVWMASMISTWSWPHYLAPLFAPLSLLLIVWGLRNAAIVGRRWKMGATLVALLVGLQAMIFVNSAITHVQGERNGWQHKREEILAMLEAMPQKDLVFVRYQKGYDAMAEWVYNAADIDASEVAWARERSPEQDKALAEYFAGRTLWLLEPDATPPRLTKRDRTKFNPLPSP